MMGISIQHRVSVWAAVTSGTHLAFCSNVFDGQGMRVTPEPETYYDEACVLAPFEGCRSAKPNAFHRAGRFCSGLIADD
jgi:hypothetical protein